MRTTVFYIKLWSFYKILRGRKEFYLTILELGIQMTISNLEIDLYFPSLNNQSEENFLNGFIGQPFSDFSKCEASSVLPPSFFFIILLFCFLPCREEITILNVVGKSKVLTIPKRDVIYCHEVFRLILSYCLKLWYYYKYNFYFIPLLSRLLAPLVLPFIGRKATTFFFFFYEMLPNQLPPCQNSLKVLE